MITISYFRAGEAAQLLLRPKGAESSPQAIIQYMDSLYSSGSNARSTSPTPLAIRFLEMLPEPSTIAVLGSGLGRDAIFFGMQGHSVVAYDLDPRARQSTTNAFRDNGIENRLLDVHNDFTQPEEMRELDAVFAFASLHYLHPQRMRGVLMMYHDRLRPGGLVASAVYENVEGQAAPETDVSMDQIVSPSTSGEVIRGKLVDAGTQEVVHAWQFETAQHRRIIESLSLEVKAHGADTIFGYDAGMQTSFSEVIAQKPLH